MRGLPIRRTITRLNLHSICTKKYQEVGWKTVWLPCFHNYISLSIKEQVHEINWIKFYNLWLLLYFNGNVTNYLTRLIQFDFTFSTTHHNFQREKFIDSTFLLYFFGLNYKSEIMSNSMNRVSLSYSSFSFLSQPQVSANKRE